jgi:hypothetical protein
MTLWNPSTPLAKTSPLAAKPMKDAASRAAKTRLIAKKLLFVFIEVSFTSKLYLTILKFHTNENKAL